MVFTGAYLESACCLLFYYSMTDRSTIDDNIAALKEAIDSMGRMIQSKSIDPVLARVRVGEGRVSVRRRADTCVR